MKSCNFLFKTCSVFFFILLSFVVFPFALAQSGTTITVTSSLDFAEEDAQTGLEDANTCDFASGAFFFKTDTCTLRRAILEAGVRPDSDRPITIEFAIPTTDPNYDAALGIWEVQIDSSFIWEIDRRFILDNGGQVTIDGGTRPGGGPAIMVNTNSDNSPLFGRSLEVGTSDNTIRNLGFHGGGQIILSEGGNTVENVWMGLTNDGSGIKLAFDTNIGGPNPEAENNLAEGGIIMPSRNSDNNTIRNNVVIGAVERAIRITSGGSGNVIENNYIGTNASGVVPVNSFECVRSNNFISSFWYGGRGMQVTGNNNQILNNTFVGLQATITTNETPPIAMEIFGANNVVEGNVVGIDVEGNKVGVCGQGLFIGGGGSRATENTFYFSRVGFDPSDAGTELDAAIISQGFSGFDGVGQSLEVRNNVIDGGDNVESNFHAYRHGPTVNGELRQFVPAKITSINGTTVRGTNGDPLTPISVNPFCPNCDVFLYLDDDDDRIESFELLGTARADASGNWTAEISRELERGEGIRTQSMSTDMNTLIAAQPNGFYAANTTTRLSDDLYTPDEVDFCLPVVVENGNVAVICL